MDQRAHYQTAPEDRIPVYQMIIYGLGAFVNNLLAAAYGGMSIILNLGLGINPAVVGLLNSLPRLTDALTDPLMGYISDHTRSKWGRRRPYIFVGAILVGIVFALLWQLPEGQSNTFYFAYFLIGSLLFFAAYTVFATPWVALGYEMTPDYHERTRLMGVQNTIGQIAYLVAPWFLAIMEYEPLFPDIVSGGRGLAVIIGVFVIVVGILPAIFLTERDQSRPGFPTELKAPPPPNGIVANVGAFFVGFGKTLTFVPFLQLCAATFLVFNGFIMISSFQPYVLIYYVCGGDRDLGAYYSGWAGSVSAAATFGVIYIVTTLSTRLGKRRAFFVATTMSIVGYLTKWVCYNPDYPMLVLVPATLQSFGLGGLFTLMPSMTADVVDCDELRTGERREGMYGSIFWWVVKLGMAGALAIGGILLNFTGFDVELGAAQTESALLLMRLFDIFVPVIFSVIAIVVIWAYPITETRAHEVRAEIEARRGSAPTEPGSGEAPA